MPALDHIPSIAEVERVAALGDPVIRNLRITQCYHELALAMTVRLNSMANWCTFATWASKQAGQTIRKQDMMRIFEQSAFTAQTAESLVISARIAGVTRSDAEVQQVVTTAIDPFGALDRASDAVARGNKKVYEEIGREFARFCATCLHDTTFDEASIANFCATLRPGDPPDGQQYLRQAFYRYYQARFETDPQKRTELMLLANIEIGFHEQTRLQPEIAEALDALFVDPAKVRSQVMKSLFPFWARVRLFILRLLGRPSTFDRELDTLVAAVRSQMHRVITHYMMTLEIPPGLRLRLGDDVPGDFPPSLRQITLLDLRALLQKIDPTPDSPRESGAVDWADLPDRIHFIVDMFRHYHEARELFDPPFTAEQLEALKAGRLPEGKF